MNVFHTPIDWQPSLSGPLLQLRPLGPQDFEALYAAGSDPLIWEQHPERDRYQRQQFERYFQSGLESKGALIAVDTVTGEVIGCSRFTNFVQAQSEIEIGYTFLIRRCWAKGYNREFKDLMLNYAFQFVDNVVFVVGEHNLRSRKAVEKLGATYVKRKLRAPKPCDEFSVVYQLSKSSQTCCY